MIKKVIQKPILIVGEGLCEVAFLGHLKRLYISRGCGINLSIKNGNGGGPEHILKRAMRIGQTQAFSVKAVLMDTDLPWTDKTIKQAKSKRVHLVGATPCFEGLLLNILEQSVPITSAECKRALQTVIGNNGTDPESYKELFTIEQLEKRRMVIAELDRLIDLICGNV